MLNRVVLCLLLAASHDAFAISDTPIGCDVVSEAENDHDSAVANINKVVDKTTVDKTTVDKTTVDKKFMVITFWVIWAGLNLLSISLFFIPE